MRFKHLIFLIFLLIGLVAWADTALSPTAQLAAAHTDNGQCVVVLHGLSRNSRSMRPIANALSDANYSVLNINYPSRRYPIETLVAEHLRPAIEQPIKRSCAVVHFVTHSMGGILLRYYLRHYRLPILGRVVMLSPPNQGSEVTDVLRDNLLYRWLNGPAGQQLGTDPDSLPQRLGPVQFELGVITGDRSINPILSTWIPREDDGKVSVERAKIQGMRAFLVVHRNHTTIMRQPEVIEHTLCFLQTGYFCDTSDSDTGNAALE